GVSNARQEFQAARDALLRRAPRLAGISFESLTTLLPPLEAAKQLPLAIDHSILPIQGPPGSGKTFTGAHMIIELVRAGKRVGVTAGRHKVITNLLDKLCEEAGEMKLTLAITQKPDQEKRDGCTHDFVTYEPDN